jgi:hypothetical protein
VLRVRPYRRHGTRGVELELTQVVAGRASSKRTAGREEGSPSRVATSHLRNVAKLTPQFASSSGRSSTESVLLPVTIFTIPEKLSSFKDRTQFGLREISCVGCLSSGAEPIYPQGVRRYVIPKGGK